MTLVADVQKKLEWELLIVFCYEQHFKWFPLSHVCWMFALPSLFMWMINGTWAGSLGIWIQHVFVKSYAKMDPSSVSHVTEALWLEGVVSWAYHIQAIHSQHPILRSMKLPTDKILADEKLMFIRWRGWLFIQLYESICVGFWRFPQFPIEFPGGAWSWWLVPSALPLEKKR